MVDLKNSNKVKAFLNGNSIWTRDSYQGIADYGEFLLSGAGGLSSYHVSNTSGVRPAFVVDLSQVNYSVVK